MTLFKVFAIICSLLIGSLTGTSGTSSAEKAAMEEQSKLFSHLFKEYHNQVTPVAFHEENSAVIKPIQLTINMALQKILYMDMKSGMMVSRIWIVMNWVDHRLAWNDTWNIPLLHVDPNILWKPDLNLFTGELEPDYPDRFPVVYPSGDVYWVPSYKATSSCSKDTRFFPNDKHTCKFMVGSWSHDASYIDLNHDGDSLFNYYEIHTDWMVLDEHVQRNDVIYPCCPELYTDITFTMTIQRNMHFYGVVLLAPAVVISMALALVFGLPPACHEKMNILVGILLSLVVLQFQLSSVVSEGTALGNFLFFSIFADLLIMVETTIVYKLFHRSTRTHPIPHWIRSFCIFNLPRVLCLTAIPHSRNYGVRLETTQNDGGDRDINIVDGSSTIEDTNEEWRFIARVVDRLSLFIFIFFYVIVTIAILH